MIINRVRPFVTRSKKLNKRNSGRLIYQKIVLTKSDLLKNEHVKSSSYRSLRARLTHQRR